MEIEKGNYKTYVMRYRKYYAQNVVPFMKSKQATAYSMIILSLFTLAFFGMFAIRPTLRTITELQRQIDDSKQLDESLQNKINQVVRAQDEYQLIKDFVPAINQALPTNPHLASVLGDVESLAVEYGATISAMQVQAITYTPKTETSEEEAQIAAQTAEPTTIDIAIQLEGSYTELSDFLNRLLTMRRTVTAQNLELSPDNENATLGLILRLNSYYVQ